MAKGSVSNVGQDMHDMLMRWISSQEPPFGVFASTDMFARNLANAVLELGLRIPDDVAIVGASNETMVCTCTEPTLSSIDYGFTRVGFEACEVLVKMVNGEDPPDNPILLPPAELVARESSDAFLVDNEIVARALKFMITECHRPIKVGDIVDASHTSRRTLTRQFQRVRGRSVTDELTRIRIGRVKRLLVESDLLIKEIAASSGYSSVNRLCECFRREEGITPQEFRKKYMKTV